MATEHTGPRAVQIDARALRVLAHPLRTRLLSELRRNGPATATGLARELGTNTGATSYHLRKLADVGLVEETADGTGRERWWTAAHDMHSWSAGDFVGDPDSEAAMEWLQGEYFRQFTQRAQDWAAEESTWPLAWREAAGASDYLLQLTPLELQAMLQEIYAVVERYRAGGAAADSTPEERTDGAQVETDHPADDRRRVLFYLHAFPEPGRKGQ
jgi:DNA-binding transcriptional ArsR family regulator